MCHSACSVKPTRFVSKCLKRLSWESIRQRTLVLADQVSDLVAWTAATRIINSFWHATAMGVRGSAHTERMIADAQRWP